MLRVIVTIIFVSVTLAPVFANAAKVNIGDQPPDYLGKDRHNDKIYLSAYKGKVVVVTFWATWCPPCMLELPILESIQRQAGPERLQVIAINYRQGRKAYRQIIRQLDDVDMTIAYDRNGRVASRYGIKGLPHMFMIDKKGHVAQIHLGYEEAAIDSIIDELNVLLLEE